MLQKHYFKLGERNIVNLWLSKFKLAILNQDIKSIETLILDIPTSNKLNELNSAKSLIKEALSLIEDKKNETSLSLNKIKNIKKYTL